MKNITYNQQKQLVEKYNGSDIEALHYMQQFTNKKQEAELLFLLCEANEIITTVGYAPLEGDYYKGKWALLTMLGIENNNGDAHIGEYYGM